MTEARHYKKPSPEGLPRPDVRAAARALEDQLVLLLGNNDLEKGRQFWLDQGYYDRFCKLLAAEAKDGPFHQAVLRNDPESVLEMLRPNRTEDEQADLNDKAGKMKKKLINFLGKNNFEKGWEEWMMGHYPFRFQTLLDESNPFFIEALHTNDFDALVDLLEVDRFLLDDLRKFEKRHIRKKLRIPLVVGVTALGIIAAEVKLISDKLGDKRDHQKEKNRKTTIDDEALHELDTGATPKLVRAFLATLPEGLVDKEVSLITFEDKVCEIPESYGPALHLHSEGAAIARGGVGADGTEIVFCKGMKVATHPIVMFGKKLDGLSYTELRNPSPQEIWDSILHEIFHASDWRKGGKMTAEEREEIQQRTKARVQDEGRFKSTHYVERISNLDDQVVEYLAVIGEEYLKGNPDLPEEDAQLIEDLIKIYDPTFTREKRDQMVVERKGVYKKMEGKRAYAEKEESLKTSSPFMYKKYKALSENPTQETDRKVDLGKQKEGRAELVNFLCSGLTNEEYSLAENYLNFAVWIEISRAITGSSEKTEIKALQKLLDPNEAMREVLESAIRLAKRNPDFLGIDPARAEELFTKIDQIISVHGIVLGGFYGTEMDRDEDRKLAEQLRGAFGDRESSKKALFYFMKSSGFQLADDYRLNRAEESDPNYDEKIH